VTFRLEVRSPRDARPAADYTTTYAYAGPREASAAFLAELVGSDKQVHLRQVLPDGSRTIANAAVVDLAEPGEDELPEPADP
jgi:hypothetical protein